MNLYLDTEFTDLVPGARLISIALVDENENSFYAELTDTYAVEHCSAFVKQHVLPYLRGKDYQMSFQECCLKLGNWIEDRRVNCVIASDAPNWDMPYLQALLKDCWPGNLEKNLVVFISIPEHIKEDIVLENKYVVHNALDDALTMKKAKTDK